MTLTHPAMEEPIEIGTETVATLVIENRSFFRHFVGELYRGINGEPCELVLAEGLKILDLPRWADFTDSIAGFTLNRRSLQTKILAAMERQAMAEDMYLKTAELLAQMENYLADLSQNFSCDLVADKLSAGALLKMAGIAVRDDYEDPLERIVDYMELVREFDRDRLFVFVNLRSYFPDDKLAEFFRTVLDHEFQLLLVDAFSAPRLEGETRRTVDEDLCEF